MNGNSDTMLTQYNSLLHSIICSYKLYKQALKEFVSFRHQTLYNTIPQLPSHHLSFITGIPPPPTHASEGQVSANQQYLHYCCQEEKTFLFLNEILLLCCIGMHSTDKCKHTSSSIFYAFIFMHKVTSMEII